MQVLHTEMWIMVFQQHITMELNGYLLLKFSIMATCCLLFVLHSYQELDKYFRGMTSMAMRTEKDLSLPFPTIVICLKDPYKKDKYPATSEEYRNLTYSLDEIIDTNKTTPNTG